MDPLFPPSRGPHDARQKSLVTHIPVGIAATEGLHPMCARATRRPVVGGPLVSFSAYGYRTANRGDRVIPMQTKRSWPQRTRSARRGRPGQPDRRGNRTTGRRGQDHGVPQISDEAGLGSGCRGRPGVGRGPESDSVENGVREGSDLFQKAFGPWFPGGLPRGGPQRPRRIRTSTNDSPVTCSPR